MFKLLIKTAKSNSYWTVWYHGTKKECERQEAILKINPETLCTKIEKS